MNEVIYEAALQNGCTQREAEVLATYVESDSVALAAFTLGIAENTAKNHLRKVRRRLGVPHTAAVVAKLVAGRSPLGAV